MELALQNVVGGSFSTYPPLFSIDSKLLLCISGSSVRCFSIETSQQIRIISPSSHNNAHKTNIIHMSLCEHDLWTLYTVSEDGQVKLWDIRNTNLIEEWSAPYTITRFCQMPQHQEKCFFISNTCVPSLTTREDSSSSSSSSSSDPPYFLYFWDFKSNSTQIQQLMQVKPSSFLTISSRGHFLALSRNSLIHVFEIDISSTYAPLQRERMIKNDETVHFLTFHPNEIILASGDRTGKIKLWPTPFHVTPRHKSPRILHWHAYNVFYFCFSHEGEYLLSGGDEAVLVSWHLQSKTQQYLPRQGSNIVSIAVSPNQNLYALGLSSNSIKIISVESWTSWKKITGVNCASLQMKKHRSLKPMIPVPILKSESEEKVNSILKPDKKATNVPSNLIFQLDPKHNFAVLEHIPGSLQFFNVQQNINSKEFFILPYRHLPQELVTLPKILSVCFHPSGDWLVTIDHHYYSDARNYSLKFWQFNSSTQTFELNTRVTGLPRLTSLQFQPFPNAHESLLVTTREDGEINVWELITLTERGLRKKSGEEVSSEVLRWHCRSSTTHSKKKNPILSAWSQDGSILAIVYEDCITLWNAETSTYLTSLLVHSIPLAIYFVDSYKVPSLIVVSKHHLVVWNLLTLNVIWEVVDMEVQCCAFNTIQSQLGLIAQSTVSSLVELGPTHFFIFELSSQVPVAHLPLPYPALLALQYAPLYQQWYALTQDQRIFILGSKASTPLASAFSSLSLDSFPSMPSPSGTNSDSIHTTIQETDPSSSHLFLRKLKVPPLSSTTTHSKQEEDPLSLDFSASKHRSGIATLLDAPPHALPNVRFLFDSLMTALLEPKQKV